MQDGRRLPHPAVGHQLPVHGPWLGTSAHLGIPVLRARATGQAGVSTGPRGYGQAGCAAAPRQPSPSGQQAPCQQPGPLPAMPLAGLRQSHRWHTVPVQGHGPLLTGTAPQEAHIPSHAADLASCPAALPHAWPSLGQCEGPSCRGQSMLALCTLPVLGAMAEPVGCGLCWRLCRKQRQSSAGTISSPSPPHRWPWPSLLALLCSN